MCQTMHASVFTLIWRPDAVELTGMFILIFIHEYVLVIILLNEYRIVLYVDSDVAL